MGRIGQVPLKEGPMSDSDEQARTTSQSHSAALAAARTAPALFVPRMVKSSDVHELIHGGGVIGRFNTSVALAITKAVGTMWAAYLFALIAFVSLPQALTAFTHGDTVVGIQWLSQSFLQLVLLPIIIVGQNVISAAQDARAEADHETLTAIHAINVQQLQILEGQNTILELLRQKAA
jgi:hypothetical protein